MNDEKIAEVCSTGAVRYDRKVPPGYKDVNKPEPDRYGDLILWLQILDKAEADKTAVIFVGDDQKEDWWREFKWTEDRTSSGAHRRVPARSGKRVYFLTPPQPHGARKEVW